MTIPPAELLDLALKGTLVLGAATLLSLVLHKASAAFRHLVWFVAVLGILALPLASARLNSLEVSWFPSWKSKAESVIAEPTSPAPKPIVLPPPATELATIPPPLPAIPAASSDATPANWPVMAWLAGITLCALPYALGLFRLWRMTRSASPLDSELQPDLAHAIERLALSRRVEVRIGANVRMPMTWGAWFPIVLLPHEFSDWSEKRRRIVLLHELAHVKRFDWLTQLLAGAAAAIYWFNPLAWLAARRMRIEREQACDDLVLRSGSKASDYADELLQIANTLGGRPWNNRAAIPMARRSSLEERLRSILADGRERRALTRWIVAMALIVMTGIVVPVAMLQAAEKENAKAETGKPDSSEDAALVRGAAQLGFKDAVVTRKDGRIVFKVDRWTVEADSGEFDNGTGKLQFRGKVVVRGKNEEFKGGSLSIGPDGMESDVEWGGSPSSGAVIAADAETANENLRLFVRLVMGSKELAFEGKPVEENAIRNRLALVPNRKQTVLELAVTSDELSWGKVMEFKTKYGQLAKELGFERASFIGVHKASSRGSSRQPRKEQKVVDAMGALPEAVDNKTRLQVLEEEIQKRRLQIAERRFQEVQVRAAAGDASQEELDEAEYQYEVAKDPANKLRHAEFRVQQLAARLRRMQARRGVTSASKVAEAEIEMLQADLDLLRLKEAQSMARAKPVSAKKDSGNSSKWWSFLAASHQDRLMNDLLLQHHTLTAELAAKRTRYLDRHPVIIEANRKLALLEQKLDERADVLRTNGVPKLNRPQRQMRTKAERAALLRQLKQLTGKKLWGVLATVHDDRLLPDLLSSYNTHELKLQSLQENHGARHPQVLQAENSVKLIKEQLHERAGAILKGMEIEIEATQDTTAVPF